MYLTQGLHRSWQQRPQQLALRDLAEPDSAGLAYADLLPQVARLAAALQAQGVAPGDRVAMLSHNSAQLVQQLLACWWLGAVAVPLNTRWAEPELRGAVADCAARLLVVDPALAWLSSQAGLAAALPTDAGEIDGAALAAQARAQQPLPDSRTGGPALAALLYTVGNTGRPKGVMLSHASLWAAAMAQVTRLQPPLDGVSLLAAPLFHVGALGRLVVRTLVGGTCLTLPQFRPDAVLAALAEHGVSDLPVAPRMLAALLDAPGFDAARVQGLRRIDHGAAPMPEPLLQRVRAAWPAAEVVAHYGLTETAGGCCFLSASGSQAVGLQAMAGTVGPAGLAAELRIVDPQGLDLPPGRVGEILVCGPMLMDGYWRQPEATAAALRDGWLHTGDAGRLDEAGQLVFVERLQDIVVSGGERVYSAEVEAVLRLHPAVADVAVVGLPHPVWGQAVHAVVVLAAGALPQPEALRRHCRKHLAGYKCPRGVSFAGSLPLSATGKVLKLQLRESLAQAQAVARSTPSQRRQA